MVYGAGNPSKDNVQTYLKVTFPKVFLVFNAISAFEFRNILFSSATKMSPFTVNFLGGFAVPIPTFPPYGCKWKLPKFYIPTTVCNAKFPATP